MKRLLIFLFFAFNLNAHAEIKLPKLFSDGMILQRDKPILVWGWADINEHIEIRFNNQKVTTNANDNGKWIVRLNPEQAGGLPNVFQREKYDYTG